MDNGSRYYFVKLLILKVFHVLFVSITLDKHDRVLAQVLLATSVDREVCNFALRNYYYTELFFKIKCV